MGKTLGVCTCPFGGGELGPNLTQCGQGRVLPACQVSSWSIQPFDHSAPTSKTGQRDRQTDRQRTDSIGRTVLQTVAQKVKFVRFWINIEVSRRLLGLIIITELHFFVAVYASHRKKWTEESRIGSTLTRTCTCWLLSKMLRTVLQYAWRKVPTKSGNFSFLWWVRACGHDKCCWINEYQNLVTFNDLSQSINGKFYTD